MNIILTGFMATGKSDVGIELSRLLGMKYIDTDGLIEQRDGMKISEIFDQKGEKYFRDAETAIAQELGEADNCVISTGGGFVLRAQNMEKIRRHGMAVNLYASVDRILGRVEGKTNRPLLNTADRKKKIEEMLKARKPFYDNCDFSIDTTDTTPEQAAKKIVEMMGTWKKSK